MEEGYITTDNQQMPKGQTGPDVPHQGMGTVALVFVAVILIWMWVQHKQLGESVAIAKVGGILLLEIWILVWLLQRGTRAAQAMWHNAFWDAVVI